MQTESSDTGMVVGPPLRPSAALLEWLERHARTSTGKRRLFRLPVVVRFEHPHRLGIEAACIGTSEADLAPESDSVRLRLDDTGMGQPLLSVLGGYCAEAAVTCAVWLEGHWGRLVDVPLPLPGMDDPVQVFAVLKVAGLVESGTSEARPLVEAER